MQRPILKWTYNTTAWKVLRYLIKNKRIAVLNSKNRKDFYNNFENRNAANIKENYKVELLSKSWKHKK